MRFKILKISLAISLVAVLLFSLIYSAIMPSVQYGKYVRADMLFEGGCQDSFITITSEIFEETFEESFFGLIVMRLDEPFMEIDGRAIKLDYPAQITDGVLYLPIIDIAHAIGGRVVYDGERITIFYDGRHIVFGFGDEEYSIGKCLRRSPLGVSEETLNFDVLLSGDTVFITNTLQTRALLVRTREGKRPGSIHNAYRAVCNGDGLLYLKFRCQRTAKSAIDGLQSDDVVIFAHPNGIVTTTSHPGGNPNTQVLPTLSDRWGAERVDTDSFIRYLSQSEKTTTDILVAVVDTGIDASHPQFVNRLRVDLGYNFVDNNTNTADDNGHGTHVAGILTDCTPDNVKIIPYKSLNAFGSGTDLQSVLAIKAAADKGVKVINISLGSIDVSGRTAYIWEEAINYAIERGSVSVAAAGNDRLNTSYVLPAGLMQVITVSASDKSDRSADFSNYGDSVDVAAPGVDILSANPGGGYTYDDGTSMSAPFVSAVASMYVLVNQAYFPAELQSLIRRTTQSRGLIWNMYLGTGVLNCKYRVG